jgi:ribosomal protein L20
MEQSCRKKRLNAKASGTFTGESNKFSRLKQHSTKSKAFTAWEKEKEKKELLNKMERREKAAFNIPGYSDEDSSYTLNPGNVYRKPEDRVLIPIERTRQLTCSCISPY